MKEYKRAELIVQAQQYEVDKNLEDGFELFSDVVTHGYVTTDGLVKIERPDGSIVCPFVQNRRGQTFIKEGDYIICEGDEKHVCGADKFPSRYLPVE